MCKFFKSYEESLHLGACKPVKCVRNYVVFWKNLHSWQKFYTTAGRGGRDKFQVCMWVVLQGSYCEIFDQRPDLTFQRLWEVGLCLLTPSQEKWLIKAIEFSILVGKQRLNSNEKKNSISSLCLGTRHEQLSFYSVIPHYWLISRYSKLTHHKYTIWI